MELENQVDNNLEIKNEQNNFFDSGLGKAIDNGIEIGLRCLLPDYVEDGVIELKDNLIEHGLKEGISKTIESVKDMSKSTIDIATGNLKNVDDIEEIFQANKVVDSMSDLLDNVLDKVKDSGKIDNNILNIVQSGKDSLLKNVEKNIEKTLRNYLNLSKEEFQLVQKFNELS